jgi:hypothetical protein
MAIRKIQGGTFDDAGHIYRDEQGVFVPSLTQVLKFQGISDYAGIAHDVMAAAAARGENGHSILESYDRYGDYDPSWVSDDLVPSIEAYKTFLADTGFVPDPEWIERAMIVSVYGMKVGMRLDRRGKFNGQDAIVELKFTSAIQPSWAVQTAAQEMGVMGTNLTGRLTRLAVQLRKDGKYRIDMHYPNGDRNHKEDGQQFSYALGNLYWRMNHGQNLWTRT